MNKIHSCTEARPAAACSFLSLPAASFWGACGMGWHGGDSGADPGALHRLPARGEPPADPLMPGTAARQRMPLQRHPCPSEEGSPPSHLVSPTLEWGGFAAQTTPGDTPGSSHDAGAHAPAPTRCRPCRHPTAHLSPAPAHVCHRAASPRHGQRTGGVTAARSGDGDGGGTQMCHPACTHAPR